MRKTRSALIALAAYLLAVAPALAAPKSTDDLMVDQVRLKLAGDPLVKDGAIGVASKDGVVTLNGAVSSQKARAKAERDAGRVPGVKSVINNLTIRTP